MRAIILILSFIYFSISQAQTTYYYVLTRQIVNGQSSKNVTGGQFVSFTKGDQGRSVCYESNKQGYQVNNSILKYDSYKDGIVT